STIAQPEAHSHTQRDPGIDDDGADQQNGHNGQGDEDDGEGHQHKQGGDDQHQQGTHGGGDDGMVHGSAAHALQRPVQEAGSDVGQDGDDETFGEQAQEALADGEAGKEAFQI